MERYPRSVVTGVVSGVAVGIDHTSPPDGGSPERLLVLKGSPEEILDRCDLAGTGVTLTDVYRSANAMAGEGLGVLVLAQWAFARTARSGGDGHRPPP